MCYLLIILFTYKAFLLFITFSCREYKNLNSFFAIVMGLSNIAVSRLSQTWEVGLFTFLLSIKALLFDFINNNHVVQ